MLHPVGYISLLPVPLCPKFITSGTNDLMNVMIHYIIGGMV